MRETTETKSFRPSGPAPEHPVPIERAFLDLGCLLHEKGIKRKLNHLSGLSVLDDLQTRNCAKFEWAKSARGVVHIATQQESL